MTFYKETPERLFIQCRKERRAGHIARAIMLAAIISMLLILGGVAVAKAQMGLSFGPTVSRYRLKGAEPDIKWKESLNGGIFANIKLGKWLSIAPELIYISKGAHINKDNAPATDRFRLNHRLIELPVTLRAGGKHLRVEAGGYASYMVNMNISKFNYGVVTEFNENDFTRFDYGLIGGLSYRWDILTFAATYEHGLTFSGKKGQPLGWQSASRAFPFQAFRFRVWVPFNLKP